MMESMLSNRSTYTVLLIALCVLVFVGQIQSVDGYGHKRYSVQGLQKAESLHTNTIAVLYPFRLQQCKKTKGTDECQEFKKRPYCYPDINNPGKYKSCYVTCHNTKLPEILDCDENCKDYAATFCMNVSDVTNVSPGVINPEVTLHELVDDATLPTTDLASNHTSIPTNLEQNKLIIIILSVLGGILVLVALGFAAYCLACRKRRSKSVPVDTMESHPLQGSIGESADGSERPALPIQETGIGTGVLDTPRRVGAEQDIEMGIDQHPQPAEGDSLLLN